MRRQASGLTRGGLAIAAAAVVLVAAGRDAVAQPMMGGGPPGRPMPDLRMMMGKPLPSPELPAGTVTVRVARKIPVNAVPGAEVVAVVKTAGGEMKKRTAKTDDRGRATFEGVGAGNRFQAQVVVDGETIKSSEFEVPAQGGVRTMLIAGLGSAMPSGGGEAGEGEGAGQGEAGGEGAAAGGEAGEAGGQGSGFRLGAAT